MATKKKQKKPELSGIRGGIFTAIVGLAGLSIGLTLGYGTELWPDFVLGIGTAIAIVMISFVILRNIED